MSNDSSGLIALSELQNLEADRVRREQHSRMAAAESERLARELEQQRAREQAAREAAEEAARIEARRGAEQAREHEERMRVQEAAARAAAEQDARLRHEQLLLDAQLRMSEQRARPRWPLVVVPALVFGLAGAAAMAWQAQQLTEHTAEQRAQAQERVELQAKTIAAVDAKLDALELQRTQMRELRAQLDAQLLAAKGDAAAQAKLLEQRDALDAEIANNDRARATTGTTKPRSTRTRPKPKPTTTTTTPTTTTTTPKPRTRASLDLADSRDPLAGID